MTAYELADELETLHWLEGDDSVANCPFQAQAKMLRQQADRIAELEKENSNLKYEISSNAWGKSGQLIPCNTTPQTNDGCGNCHACLVGVMENNMPVTSQRMIVCSDCGNKRCPKASNHRHKCTGSNEVGQYGSIYTAPRELSDEEILNIAFCSEIDTVAIENDWNGTVLQFAREILKKASEK